MDEQKKKFNKIAYDNAFIAQNYDRVNLTVPKGKKEDISIHAKNQGESTNAFINRAIDETMTRDNAKEKGED